MTEAIIDSESQAARAARLSDAILDDWSTGRFSAAGIALNYGFPNPRLIEETIRRARIDGDDRALTRAARNAAARAALADVPRGPSVAELMGIKIGETIRVQDETRVLQYGGHPSTNLITLSAGDANWDSLPKHFAEDDSSRGSVGEDSPWPMAA